MGRLRAENEEADERDGSKVGKKSYRARAKKASSTLIFVLAEVSR